MDEIIFTIIECSLRLDTEKVQEYTSYLADHLEENKELASADRLRRILKGEPQNVIIPLASPGVVAPSMPPLTAKYRKVPVDDYGPGSREVMDWHQGVVFMCPCDYERRYITSPPHAISFGDDGILSLEPSIGYRERRDLDRKENWCHFYIRDGTASMVGDSECPGKNL